MKPFTLVGVDSNAFNILGYTLNAMRKAKFSADEIKLYQRIAMEGDYYHLMAVSQQYIDKVNEKLGLEEEDYDDEE